MAGGGGTRLEVTNCITFGKCKAVGGIDAVVPVDHSQLAIGDGLDSAVLEIVAVMSLGDIEESLRQ